MSRPLDPQTKKQVAARIGYYRELGIYDFYKRGEKPAPAAEDAPVVAVPVAAPAAQLSILDAAAGPPPESAVHDRKQALELIREDIGDCKRCGLHENRTNIVFGTGNPEAELMFVGEGPGADEDAQGLPFVGRAGQLLNSMIAAMGLKREDVYIANVVKCRPPGNRTPEREECDTCSPFLLRQVAAIQPKVIVALGAVAAKNLLAMNESMAKLRGRWYDFRGTRLAVTYHPAFLLRDPRQKGEAWKDLQMVMEYLGLQAPKK
jgi:uracil-DNA glycosylase family 4